MTSHTTTAELDAMLAAALPTISKEGKRLAGRLARLLAPGEPLDTEAVASALGQTQSRAEAAIDKLPWIVRDDLRRVVGVWGLAVLETPHRLRVAGRDLFAFCAIDALYLPFLLGEDIDIASTCPATGTPITLTASREGLSTVAPAAAAVSLRIPANGLTVDFAQVLEDACHFIHFFASNTAARQWAAERDAVFTVSIEEAFELAARSLAARLVAE
jgi:alkylmercury lyase